MKKILQVGDKRLEKKSRLVDDISDARVIKVIDELLKLVKSKKETGVGMSAPQIGESLRIFVIKRVDLREQEKKTVWEVMINPQIIEKSKNTSTIWEGCFSVQKGRLFGPVTRSEKIKVKYLDTNGTEKTFETKGNMSHFVQHEYDHLDGIIFLKYVNNPQNLWKLSDLDAYIEKHGESPPIYD